MADRLAGKVALISGGARGQGACEARLFVNEGARVVIGDILDDVGQRTVEELNRASETRRAAYVHLDVTQLDDWEQAIAVAGTTFSDIHILVNYAAISGQSVRLEEPREADWQCVIDINNNGD